jgi:hypothetical protein
MILYSSALWVTGKSLQKNKQPLKGKIMQEACKVRGAILKKWYLIKFHVVKLNR